ncbi:MAG: DUF488 domain-containing protein [Geitlerinemataceae cyanobacterium]
MMELLTIGHSNHTIESFLDLLQKYEVTALTDVRSHPYSRYLPQFNQRDLKASLRARGIEYVFLGKELGARTDDLSCYVEGKAVYEKIAATEAFQEGIQRVLKGTQKYKIALMCAEQDPLTCHRSILVCQHLRQFDLNISHILKNGDLESHQKLEDRMLAKNGFTEVSHSQKLQQLSLFSDPEPEPILSRDEYLSKAYQLQGDKIAYVEKETRDREPVR